MSKAYDIIYADPPWAYASPMFTKTEVSYIIDVYPTMGPEALRALPVQELCAENCLLFMWATSPLLPQALQLGEAWGFKYITVVFVWNKMRSNPGVYTWSQCEICLLFKKGKIPQPQGTHKVAQYIQSLRGAHSQKPQAARRRIELMFPTQKKLELFARSAYPGWDVWGNQAKGSIDWQKVKPIKSNQPQPKFGFLY